MATQPSECNTNVKRPAAQATSVMFHPSPPSAAAIYALHSRRALSTHSSRANLHLDSAKKSGWQSAMAGLHTKVDPKHHDNPRCHPSGLMLPTAEAALRPMPMMIRSCRICWLTLVVMPAQHMACQCAGVQPGDLMVKAARALFVIGAEQVAEHI